MRRWMRQVSAPDFVTALLAARGAEQGVTVRVAVPGTDDAPLYVLLRRTLGWFTVAVFDDRNRELSRRVEPDPCDVLLVVASACGEVRETRDAQVRALLEAEHVAADAQASAAVTAAVLPALPEARA